MGVRPVSGLILPYLIFGDFMYLCDSHTHSLISMDCGAPLADMAKAAIAAGLDELCVTDHCDLLDGDGAPMTGFDWPAAKAQYHTVKEQAGNQLTLRLGLELGSAVYAPETARTILAEGGDTLDFVLGSLHNWIGAENNIDFYFTDFHNDPALAREALENALDGTWRLVTDCPDCYDSLAHIIYPLRYMARDGQNLSLADYEDRVRAILAQVAQTGHALEVNTNRGKDLAVWLPILRWFRECGGKLVTLGSDAHRPEDMAKGIADAASLLRDAGFGYVATFTGRQPVMHPLTKI